MAKVNWKFTNDQIKSLALLSRHLMDKYGIFPHNIVGINELKEKTTAPGPMMPWKRLRDLGGTFGRHELTIGLWPQLDLSVRSRTRPTHGQNVDLTTILKNKFHLFGYRLPYEDALEAFQTRYSIDEDAALKHMREMREASDEPITSATAMMIFLNDVLDSLIKQKQGYDSLMKQKQDCVQESSTSQQFVMNSQSRSGDQKDSDSFVNIGLSGGVPNQITSNVMSDEEEEFENIPAVALETPILFDLQKFLLMK